MILAGSPSISGASLLGLRQIISVALKEDQIGRLKEFINPLNIKIMITNEIYRDFAIVKSLLTPGKVVDRFKLTKEGVYLYVHSNRRAEIIGFSSKEAEEAYEAKCNEVYNKYFNN